MEPPLLRLLTGTRACCCCETWCCDHSLGLGYHTTSPSMGLELLLLSGPPLGPKSWHHLPSWLALLQLCAPSLRPRVMALNWHRWGWAAAALHPVPCGQSQNFDSPSPRHAADAACTLVTANSVIPRPVALLCPILGSKHCGKSQRLRIRFLGRSEQACT